MTILEAGTSQNGWPANSDPAVIDVASFPVPGSSPARSLMVRDGDIKTILIGVAARFNSTVEPLGSDIGGYNYRPIAGSTVLSNHASGTAIDLNWNEHPQGASGTFTAAQVAAIRRILGLCGNVVRWGGDYNSTVDEMHFEINVPPGSSSLSTCAEAFADTVPSVPVSLSSGRSYFGDGQHHVYERGVGDS
ncbi:M15 family metallopeptidase, partial [Plantactinospora siamensis]